MRRTGTDTLPYITDLYRLQNLTKCLTETFRPMVNRGGDSLSRIFVAGLVGRVVVTGMNML